jgi:hypothetical protein
MKFATDPPYADPEAAARKLVRLAKSVKTIQDGRIYIAEIKEPFLSEHGSLNGYEPGLEWALQRGWLHLHESGTFVRLTKAGAELCA